MTPFALGAAAAAAAFIVTAVAVVCLPAMAVMLALGVNWRAGIGLTLGLAIPAIALTSYRRGPQNRAEELVTLGCCGTCGYPLDALPPTPAGMTPCPECGSTWRVAPAAATRCPICQAPLGNPRVPDDGRIECPECESALRIRIDAARE
ncbi:MAG: hypothetical protein KF699_08215 [Phycisphaeraceae bacterium]|nr:hypothetical protein [Phycisphaeraceae bacterium]